MNVELADIIRNHISQARTPDEASDIVMFYKIAGVFTIEINRVFKGICLEEIDFSIGDDNRPVVNHNI